MTEHPLTHTPFHPMNCCPACGRTYNQQQEESKPRTELLTNEEIELLQRLRRLVNQHKQFLDNIKQVAQF